MILLLSVKKTLPFLFADDTNLFINGKNLQILCSDLNDELDNISTWLKVNKLSLNIKKTHFIVFTSKKNKVGPLSIKIDGQQIEEVSCTKFLGVYIDSKLNWKKHIEYISGKVSKGIGIILKAYTCLSVNLLKHYIFHLCTPFFVL